MVGGGRELALIQSWEASEEKLSSVLVSPPPPGHQGLALDPGIVW